MLGGNSACLNRAILACQSVYREKAATTVLKMSIGVFGRERRMTFIWASLKPICKVYNLVPVTAEEKRCRFEQYEMIVMGFISVNQFRRANYPFAKSASPECLFVDQSIDPVFKRAHKTDHRLATARSPVPPAKLVKTLQVRLGITFVHVRRQCSQGQASKRASRQAMKQEDIVFVVPKAAPFCLAVGFYFTLFCTLRRINIQETI
ncbi:hypothetical protein T09_10916 [Trichinella sp. T9]|uniref:Uncharacterized protein n=1 Tax=Trichinella murrelli TaxID=144512 RepID=A0A0V0TMD0_9BILA|nr:hypothetical protein T05_271 [Trichinella murrelli]KRX63950.1 hypothetical protein T09_10916 [Trichinella sp. T9]